jgi:hypothetical protein
MGKSPKSDLRDPIHSSQPGDKISGDCIIVECRKPDKGWRTFRMSENHHGYRVVARKNASATVEVGFTNVRS